MYSEVYFFKLTIPRSPGLFGYDHLNNGLYLTSWFYNTNLVRYWNGMRYLFQTIHCPLFLKVRFKGKGYYIFKNKRQTITPQFGHSHRLYLYSYFVSVRFLSKTHILLFGLVKEDLVTVSLGVKGMRKINIFTGRGVRFNRQIIYRKTGKVSSYR